MVDYKVFYVIWTSAVLAQCIHNKSSVSGISDTDGSSDADSDVGMSLLPSLTLIGSLTIITVTSGLFYNWLWRFVVFLFVWFSGVLAQYCDLPLTYTAAFTLWAMIHTSPIISIPILGIRKPQARVGAVFVTGCDSGMGFYTAIRLAKLGYKVYAGCYTLDKSQEKFYLSGDCADLLSHDRIVCVSLDVTNDASVKRAYETVKASLEKDATSTKSKPYDERLVGIVNCAGLGYNGPAEYFPIDLYQKQMDVNYFGYVRVIQHFMPLLRKGTEGDDNSECRRGRIIMIGTGGGILSPAPPLLSAYMSSKWAIEAYAGCMRLEMQLAKRNIDVVMLNPGFIKPTQLMSVGLKLTEQMWDQCSKTWNNGTQAKDEYGALLQQFIEYSANEKGTHVSKVAQVMGEIMDAYRPNACYKVGDDSKAAPVVGLLPTAIREFIVKYSMYQQVGTT